MDPINAHEGWFVSHLFFEVDRLLWDSFTSEERRERKENFRVLVESFRRQEKCQLNAYSIWGLKADLGLMLVDPDLHHLNKTEYELAASLGAGVLRRVDSFVSVSEISEYMSQDKDYDRTLREKEGLDPDSALYQQKMGDFKARMQVYINDRLYPSLPAHRVFCFYPMSKQRGDSENWYLLDFDARKEFMAGHAITGRRFQDTVRQLVTGSIGLDDWEWGVTLFSNDPYYFKKLLYEMRYDEASARFGEFGMFYIGLRFEPDELFDQLMM
jgi:chlorite dismutase